MFTVKWIVHKNESQPVDSEVLTLNSLNALVALCQSRLPVVRHKFPRNPPDGFIVLDGSATEVRRWIEPHLRTH